MKTVQTVHSTNDVAQLVGRLTMQLGRLEEDKECMRRHRHAIDFELCEARQQLANLRLQLGRLQLLAGLFLAVHISRSFLSKGVFPAAIGLIAEKIETFVSVLVAVQILLTVLFEDVTIFAKSAKRNSSVGVPPARVPKPNAGSENDSDRIRGASGLNLEGAGRRNLNPEFLPSSESAAGAQLIELSHNWDTEAPTYQDDTGLAVFYRQSRGVHEFKFDVTLDTGVAPVFALARELELMPTWHPYVKRGLTLEYHPPSAGKGCKLRGYIEIGMPWPLPNVAAVLRVNIYDLLQSDGTVVIAASTEEDLEAETSSLGGEGTTGSSPPTTPTECPRLSLHFMGRAEPLSCKPPGTKNENEIGEESQNSSRFTVIAKARFPFSSTPQWIIRFVIRTMAPIVVAKVRELIPRIMDEKGDSAFPEKMRSDPALYDDFLTEKVYRTLHTRLPQKR